MTTFIQAKHHGGHQERIDRIVIHRTESPMRKGAARAVANYFANTLRPVSAHYVLDPGEVVQCLFDHTIGYHAPPNEHSIGVELCGYSANDDWSTVDGGAMFGLAIPLVADLCARHGVPAVWLTVADLMDGRRGITSHANIALAWHKTSHTDPGPHFPHESFVAAVVRSIHKEGAKMAEGDVGFYDTDDDVYIVQKNGGVRHYGPGDFYGSYPGLKPEERMGTRSFVGIRGRRDGKPGYVLIADDGSRYTFPVLDV